MTHPMNHWSLFRQSWSILWRNPALWLFGLFAALSSGPNFYNPGLGNLRRVNPLRETAEAFRYLEEEHARGKVVITVDQNN